MINLFDNLQEIFETVKKNKLRTALTAFSVSWGLFMLIILLGAGRGLRNGFEENFKDDAINSIWVWPGQTSIPYKGYASGREISFTNQEYDLLKRKDGIDKITGRWGRWGENNITYGKEYANFNIRSVHPDHKYLENTQMIKGRYINETDIKEFRKVCTIGLLVEQALFKGKESVGEYIGVNGIPFEVVGVFEDAGGQGEMKFIYLPLTTGQRVFNGGNTIHQIMFTLEDGSPEGAATMAQKTREFFAERFHFDPADENALFVNNNVEEFKMFNTIMGGIEVFVWIIGIGTIIAGIVGVSNIMLISVNERTKEIGVRKALGAKPSSIISMIMTESIITTAFAGYVGLVGGIFLLELMSTNFTEGNFRNPSVDLNIALAAFGLLVAAGFLAGFIPARRAASIQPVEALKEE